MSSKAASFTARQALRSVTRPKCGKLVVFVGGLSQSTSVWIRFYKSLTLNNFGCFMLQAEKIHKVQAKRESKRENLQDIRDTFKVQN